MSDVYNKDKTIFRPKPEDDPLPILAGAALPVLLFQLDNFLQISIRNNQYIKKGPEGVTLAAVNSAYAGHRAMSALFHKIGVFCHCTTTLPKLFVFPFLALRAETAPYLNAKARIVTELSYHVAQNPVMLAEKFHKQPLAKFDVSEYNNYGTFLCPDWRG